jgi:V8-like Glu-specific endopeptidase
VKRIILIFILIFGFLTPLTPLASGISFPDESRLQISRSQNVISFWNYDPETYVRTEKFCTGVMLDEITFLTAAHCLQDAEYITAVKNQSSKWDRGESLMIYDFVIHPRYSESTSQNDLAIGILNFKARNTNDILNYTLANQNFVSKSTYIYGWGLDQNRRDSGYLNRAKLIDYSAQGKKYFPRSFNSKTMIAAGKYNSSERVFSGACYGDSGGPLFAETSKGKSVIGITSFIKGPNCDVSSPTIFTRISYYKDFIKSERKRLIDDFEALDTVSPEIDKFSLPWDTTNVLPQYGNTESKWTSAPLQTGGGTGAADIEAIMLQTWKTKPGSYSFGINAYLTSPIESCIEKQKGSWLVQVSLSSVQKVDLQFRINPSSGCYTPEKTDFNIATLEVTPPALEVCEPPGVKPWSSNKNSAIDSFTFYLDKGCIGTSKNLWIRIKHEVENRGDIEPGVDMWAGPFSTSQPS